MKKIKLLKQDFTYLPCLFFLLCSVCFLPDTVLSEGAAEEGIARIQKAYENIEDMSGSFVQKSYIKDLKRTETFGGRFFIKRPLKMKWDYTGQQPQEVLISNDRITIYQKKEKQAFTGKFDRDTYGQAPVALLSGFGKMQEEFSVSGENGRLLLKPKKPMGGILSVEIEPSDGEFPIKSFTIKDSFSNRIEMTLKDVKINTGLKDTFFELSLPKDITTFEHKP